jgi:hypothetical protein
LRYVNPCGGLVVPGHAALEELKSIASTIRERLEKAERELLDKMLRDAEELYRSAEAGDVDTYTAKTLSFGMNYGLILPHVSVWYVFDFAKAVSRVAGESAKILLEKIGYKCGGTHGSPPGGGSGSPSHAAAIVAVLAVVTAPVLLSLLTRTRL